MYASFFDMSPYDHITISIATPHISHFSFLSPPCQTFSHLVFILSPETYTTILYPISAILINTQNASSANDIYSFFYSSRRCQQNHYKSDFLQLPHVHLRYFSGQMYVPYMILSVPVISSSRQWITLYSYLRRDVTDLTAQGTPNYSIQETNTCIVLNL